MKASIRKRLDALQQKEPAPVEVPPRAPEPRAIIRCRECFFWRMEGYYGPASPMTGNCHLFPPNDRGAYGKTTPEDWCSGGEAK